MPRPRYLTPRNPDRRSFGPNIARTSALLGRPFMPWQHAAAGVIGEVDAEGRFAYPLVIMTVQRQAGKTAMNLATAVQRCTMPRRRVWYTAQTGTDARDKFLEMVDEAEAAHGGIPSPLSKLWESKRGAGNTRMAFRTGSEFRPHPPTVDSLHGKQSDLNMIDEAWSFTEAEGDALLQAIVPTQATRPGAQVIILSTAGDATSTWFHNLIDTAPERPGVALIDFGIGPDVDPTDLDAVAAAHPAYGHTIDHAALEAALAQLGPGGFARAYGNRRTSSRERVIPAECETAAETTIEIPAGVPVGFGVAVAVDRSATAIAATAIIDGVPVAEIVEHRPGTAWAAPYVADLAGTNPHHGVAIDRFGPSSTVADELDLAGVELLPIGTRDVTTASADIYDRITHRDEAGELAPRILLRRDPALAAAIAAAAWRQVGDARTWGRRTSAGSIAPLEAVTLSTYAATHLPAPEPAPMIWTGQ
ncbi:terminase large subunit [Gordonia phage Emperor]|uniref:Terminase large subunit n=1 Tax=Gordonia phage Emperor TaxID=2201427 RepID=A0A2Z4Q4D2_9CAUD|nr:terminase large subunit [Gordonia phage Emperor]AWY04749.1 terminase large subunit [Gordonia phage Emperor]